ncbi:MAG: hypothetical protein M1834_008725 [Cirrosporium novae-zelandiae]|nr:MAG: hypothetical protein M1834_008725 [Cirrosporium novae-zelandiae]
MKLLGSPFFIRLVQNIHKSVGRLRNGVEPGGPSMEGSGRLNTKIFWQYFVEELKNQAGWRNLKK